MGKGPVRGYPPSPGQPPPMYPPGQFAAWNRGRRAADDGPAGGGQAPGANRADRPGAVGSAEPPPGQPDSHLRTDGGSRRAGSQWQDGQAGPGSRYYARDESPDAEPGYSMLAVSDPAADVTSTQTWQAIGDGRATGVWTMPNRPDAAAGADQAERGPQTRADAELRPVAGRRPLTDPRPVADSRPATAADALAAGSAAAARPDSARPESANTAPAQTPAVRAPSAQTPAARPPTGPVAATPAAAGAAVKSAAPERRGRAAGTRRAGSSGSRRSRPPNVTFAVGVALLFVLAAAATLGYTLLHHSAGQKPTAGSSTKPSAQPSASPSPTLGPYGHIAARSSDPQPLTVAQLFPASFTGTGGQVSRTASALGKHCGSALIGSRIQSAVSAANCTQVVRATYLAGSQQIMGTIGVLNLSSAARATRTARSADASDYISPLKGKRAPTKRIGGGTGIEEAAAKGHYLILIWAEYTNLRKPKTGAERAALVTFMSDLLRSTANVSLTTRMLNGTP